MSFSLTFWDSSLPRKSPVVISHFASIAALRQGLMWPRLGSTFYVGGGDHELPDSSVSQGWRLRELSTMPGISLVFEDLLPWVAHTGEF